MMDLGSLARSRLFLSATGLLPALQFPKIFVEPVEPPFPQPSVFPQPGIDSLERLGFETAGAPLRLTSARNQTGALKHL